MGTTQEIHSYLHHHHQQKWSYQIQFTVTGQFMITSSKLQYHHDIWKYGYDGLVSVYGYLSQGRTGAFCSNAQESTAKGNGERALYKYLLLTVRYQEDYYYYCYYD